MRSDLVVAALQWDLHWHNPKANREKAEFLMNKKVNGQAFFLPEMFTTGFTMETASLAEKMDGPSVQWMVEQSHQRKALIAGSLIIKDGNCFYNRMICAFPDKSIKHYDKKHLFSFAGEDKHFRSGGSILTFHWMEWEFKPLICYDLRFPVWSRNSNQTDLIVYVANWPSARAVAWNALLKARAIENQCYVIGVNRAGVDGNGIGYSGDTQVVDYEGKLIAWLGNEEGIASVQLQAQEIHAFRKKYPFWRDRDQFTLKNN